MLKKSNKSITEQAIISYILREMMHVLPVVPSRTRIKGYERTIPVNWGGIIALTIRAHETLNAFDLLTLLAITRLFIENEPKDGGIFYDETGKPVRKMYTLSTSKYCFVKEYRNLNPSTSNKRLVESSFSRLADCTWQYNYSDGGLLNVKILMDWKITKDKRYAFWGNKTYIDNINRNKDKRYLKVLMNFIFKCKTDIGKLLVFWLEGQQGNKFHENVLMSVLHLEYSQKKAARLKLKKAFEDAVKSNYLLSWKFDKGYFSFERCKIQIINKELIIPQ
jgi:hypothetical protein